MTTETQAATVATPAMASLVPRDPTPSELGRRIKLLRVSRGLTLKDLEERGRISATHVSEIERGKASPTVGALAKIARALGVRPAFLIEPRVLPEQTSSTSESRQVQRVSWANVAIEPLAAPIEGSNMGAYLMHLPVGDRESGLAHVHDGEEWVMAIDGVVEIRVQDRVQVLREGDSLHFWGHRHHVYSNLGNTPAQLLVVVRPRLNL